jgi:PKD repeat protein
VTVTSGLTVTANGSGSTDTDATPIATYRFDFGDGTSAVTTTAPTASTQHTYAAGGTYTVTLICTDTAGKASTAVTKSVTVSGSSGSGIAVYAGYYDTHHPDQPKAKPSPWKGSSNTIFAGTADPDGRWDTSAVRVDNLSGSSLSGVSVTVDMGSSHFALWGTYTIPAGQRLIFAQTGVENFDGSDTNVAGCYYCSPTDCNTKVSSAVPVVHVKIGTKTTDYVDPGQVLNTHGVDAAGCPYTGTRKDESSQWVQIYPRVSIAADAAPMSNPDGVIGSDRPGPELWLGPLSPNPTHGTMRVDFRMPVGGPVRLDILDVAGRIVHQGTNDLFGPGEHSLQVDLSSAPPGIYFCALTTQEGILRQAFVLVR